MKSTLLTLLTLLLILLLAMLLRFYHVGTMTIFDADQEFAATFATEVLTIFPVRLIGQGISVQGLFLGPWYFYSLVPFYALYSLHPMGGVVGSVVLGLVTLLAYYLIGKTLFGTRAGLILAFFRAISFSFIEADILVTPAFSSDIIILLSLFCMHHYFLVKKWYIFPLSLLFGFYTSMHPVLFPFIIVFCVLILLRRQFPSLLQVATSIILVLLPVFPLLLFEYYRKFMDVKVLFMMRQAGLGEVKTVATLHDYFDLIITFPASFLVSKSAPEIVILATTLFTFTVTIIAFKKARWAKNNFHLQLLLSSLVVFPLYYILLPIHASDYYFIGIRLLLFFYFALGISYLASLANIGNKLVAGVILGVVVITNLTLYKVTLTQIEKTSLFAKEGALQFIANDAKERGRHIEIAYNMERGQDFGFGYLHRYYQMEVNPNLALPKTKYTLVVPLSQRRAEIDKSFGNIGIIIEDEESRRKVSP